MFEDLNKQMSISVNDFINELQGNPWEIIALILDVIVVGFLIYEFVRIAKKSKVWQLVKGIAFLIIITFLSGILKLRILNFIMTSIMTYGVIAMLIIFQPELRRALEQLGSSNTFSKIFLIWRPFAKLSPRVLYKSSHNPLR